MSDDQENIVDEITGSLLRSQTAKELEIQLRQLRKGWPLQHRKKPVKERSRHVSRMELKLPDIHSSTSQIKCWRGLTGAAPDSSMVIESKGRNTSASRSANIVTEGRKSFPARSKINLTVCGNNMDYTKTLAIESSKTNFDTGKLGSGSVESVEKCISSVISGPCFRPWSRGKKEKKKHMTRGHYSLQEASIHRFYLKQQRTASDCFNLSRIVCKVSDISGRASENHANGELVPIMVSYKMLYPGLSQSRGFDDKDDLIDETEKSFTFVKKVTSVKKEQRLKKLLRRKLITCYDLGTCYGTF